MASPLYDRSSPYSLPMITSSESEVISDEMPCLSTISSLDNNDSRRKKPKIGFHFHPNNDEIFDHYLKNKVLGIDLQEIQAIAEIDILDFEPPDLPARSAVQSEDQYWYFFYRLVDYRKRKRGGGGGNNRTVKNGKGKWKATGKTRLLRSEKTNQQIGTKKTLVYCPDGPRASPEVKAKGNGKAKFRSEWTMHEYHLPSDFPNPEKYVIVKLKKKGGKPLNLSPANGEAINFTEDVRETLAASIACADNVLAITPLNESSQSSFIQNGFVEQELSCQLMSSSPFLMHNPPTELEASSGCYNSTFDNTIKQWSLTQADWDAISEPNWEGISEPDWDEISEFFKLSNPLQPNVGSTPSPRSPKFVEQIQQPPQGCVPIAQVTTVDP